MDVEKGRGEGEGEGKMDVRRFRSGVDGWSNFQSLNAQSLQSTVLPGLRSLTVHSHH